MSFSLLLAVAAMMFTLIGTFFITLHRDFGWPSGTPNPRYFSSYGMLVICWGNTLLFTPGVACFFSDLIADLRATDGGKLLATAKMVLPRMCIGVAYLVYALIGVFASGIDRSNFALYFAEAYAHTYLVVLALMAIIVMYQFNRRKLLTDLSTLVIEFRLTKGETTSLVLLSLWGMLCTAQLRNRSSLFMAEMIRLAFLVTFGWTMTLICTAAKRKQQRTTEIKGGQVELVEKDDKKHRLVFDQLPASSEGKQVALTLASHPGKAVVLEGEVFSTSFEHGLGLKMASIKLGDASEALEVVCLESAVIAKADERDLVLDLYWGRAEKGNRLHLLSNFERHIKYSKNNATGQRFKRNTDDGTLSPCTAEGLVLGWVPDKWAVQAQERETILAARDEAWRRRKEHREKRQWRTKSQTPVRRGMGGGEAEKEAGMDHRAGAAAAAAPANGNENQRAAADTGKSKGTGERPSRAAADLACSDSTSRSKVHPFVASDTQGDVK